MYRKFKEWSVYARMKYVIMCGGTYNKFKVPKPLLKIKGEVLVERTIRLLKENGVTDIVISTNNKAFDYIDVPKIRNKDNKFVCLGNKERVDSKYSWLKAYCLLDEPVCYLHGDVYYSSKAIKRIVEKPVAKTMFFCVGDKFDVLNRDKRNIHGREPLAYKVQDYKLFNFAIRDLLEMIDDGLFKDAKYPPIAWTVYRYLNGLDLGFKAQSYSELNSIFTSHGDYVVINDYTTDIDKTIDVERLEEVLKDVSD